MEQRITNIITHMSRSYHELAKIIQAERHITVHMAQLVAFIPDHPTFNDPKAIVGHVEDMSSSITAYLTNLADLEDAIAENITYILGELQEQTEE
jgi:hydroxymethylpyrimidine/phosphomethylpyrimidine kinase